MDEEVATTTASIAPADKDTPLALVMSGAVAGHLVEWYDFLLYGYAAVVIADQFFPAGHPTVAMLNTFGIFALSFIARPIGGVLFGHIGDKLGRTKTLVLVIGMMSGGTAMIGAVPNYDTIGLWAPVLLVVARVMQGISAGGELSGATALIAEFSPQRKRGFYLGFLSVAFAISAILASGVVGVLGALLSPAAFSEWGWRIAFLLSVPLGIIGLIIRLRLGETPAFRDIQKRGRVVRIPIVAAVKNQGLMILALIPFFGVTFIASFYLTAFYPAFLVNEGQLSTSQSSLVNLFSFAVVGVCAPIFGHIADRFGRKLVRGLACAVFAVFAIPTILLASTGSLVLAIVGLSFLGVAVAALNVSSYLCLTELFHVETRYTASAVSYNTASVAFGGTAPLVGTALMAAAGTLAAAGYVMVFALIGLVFALRLPEISQPNTDA